MVASTVMPVTQRLADWRGRLSHDPSETDGQGGPTDQALASSCLTEADGLLTALLTEVDEADHLGRRQNRARRRNAGRPVLRHAHQQGHHLRRHPGPSPGRRRRHARRRRVRVHGRGGTAGQGEDRRRRPCGRGARSARLRTSAWGSAGPRGPRGPGVGLSSTGRSSTWESARHANGRRQGRAPGRGEGGRAGLARRGITCRRGTARWRPRGQDQEQGGEPERSDCKRRPQFLDPARRGCRRAARRRGSRGQ